MSRIKVICQNHGVIQEIDYNVMYLGRPPVAMAFCPTCGTPTKKEHIEDRQATYTITQADIDKAKQREIDYYRKKYWPELDKGEG